MRLLLLPCLAAALSSQTPGAATDDRHVTITSAAVVELDPASLLPPPPAPGGRQARTELAELRAVEAGRTAADVASARSDGDLKDASIFAEAIGPAFVLARLPATGRLMAVVRSAEKAAVDRGKSEFARPRPWIVDPDLKSCERGSDPLSSYPSGHASMAFSMGAVLARAIPGRAGPIMTRAARYGESRIVCGQHFRSDVTAGEALGLVLAERLMERPAFRSQFDAAVAELRAAGLR